MARRISPNGRRGARKRCLLVVAVVIICVALHADLDLLVASHRLASEIVRMAQDQSSASSATAAANNNTSGPFSSATALLQDYKDALARLSKLKAVGSTHHVTCDPALEIGWREPADLVPRHIGNKCEPWWTRDAVYLLGRVIRPHWKVLEWGAGSSTVWFSTMAGSVTTIEDDGNWTHDLGWMINAHGMSNVELRHRARQQSGAMESASRGCCYDNYVNGAVDIPDGSQDLVSVDGRARELCLKEAVRLVRPAGGIVVLDNSVRERYQNAIQEFIPGTWLRHDAALLTNTTITTEKQQYWIKRDDLFTTFWITR